MLQQLAYPTGQQVKGRPRRGDQGDQRSDFSLLLSAKSLDAADLTC